MTLCHILSEGLVNTLEEGWVHLLLQQWINIGLPIDKGRAFVVSHNNKINCDVKPKTSFLFNNYPLRLFKLIATSPLINSCPMQKIQKTPNDDIHCFYVLFCLPPFACPSSLSMVLPDCWHENTWPFAI